MLRVDFLKKPSITDLPGMMFPISDLVRYYYMIHNRVERIAHQWWSSCRVPIICQASWTILELAPIIPIPKTCLRYCEVRIYGITWLTMSYFETAHHIFDTPRLFKIEYLKISRRHCCCPQQTDSIENQIYCFLISYISHDVLKNDSWIRNKSEIATDSVNNQNLPKCNMMLGPHYELSTERPIEPPTQWFMMNCQHSQILYSLLSSVIKKIY